VNKVEGTVQADSHAHELEELLLEEGLVDTNQLERARRIVARLQKSKPVGEVLVELGQLARSEMDRVVRLHRSKLSIARVLQEEGSLDNDGLEAYVKAKSLNPRQTDRQILVDGALVTEDQFLRALSTKHDIPYVEPDVSLVDTTLLSDVSIPYLMRNKALPFRMTDGHLNVIMSDPLDSALINELERMYRSPVQPCVAASSKIEEALETLERLRDVEGQDVSTTLQYREINEMPEDDDSGEGAIRIVDYLIYQAISLGASDLHIEPLQNKVRARVRVDGVLRQLTDLPSDFSPRVVSRVKVLAGMDIAERRLHQDGRFFVKADGREIDIRVSAYACVFGETLVLRLLDRNRGLIPLDSLGFEDRILALLREVVLRSSSGLVLVTGPTGSGKTTTMYSFIDYVKDDTLKVITCENPVEYTLDGTAQCSVNEKTGPTFADSLRAIVRQDPDIIVVGEIRDGQTANLAVEAALTGHKVLSTFHTEDAVTAVIRLLEMGVEPFLVASTLSCVVAQRLVRRICDHCRKPGEYAKSDLRFLGLSREDVRGFPLVEGAGCPECEGIGYRGRTGIHEVLLLTDDFRDAVLRRAASRELRRLARESHGFLTLQEDGLLKVAAGMTTLSELAKSVPRDPGARGLSAIQEVAAMRRFK
jgi:type IV pilus assembly protein PilB